LAPIVRVEKVSYSYPGRNGGAATPALREVSLAVEPGEFLVILGHNGSGKSTLARHLNGLLLPDSGNVFIHEWNTRDKGHLRDIRTMVGMVFQQPDNQIVATIVEEDVAFGPENLGVGLEEMRRRVDWALGEVAMQPYRLRAPHLLSGGQKQRVAIAGVLAMQPNVLVLDEATAMLDPQGRKDVMEIAHRLHRERGVTVIAITHFMREALDATRMVVMDQGCIALDGTPRELFSQREKLRALQLDLPHVSQIAGALHARFPAFPANLLTTREVVDAVRNYTSPPAPLQAERGEVHLIPDSSPFGEGRSAVASTSSRQVEEEGEITTHVSRLTSHALQTASPVVIDVEDLEHVYMRGTPLAVQALFDIDMQVRRGEIVGVIGHTGSGKSTAIQHLNGLLLPHGGKVAVLGMDTASPQTDLRVLRRRAGLVFQFPEAQLFEQYAGDDVAFGPRQMGLSAEEVRARVRRAMESLGLGFEEFKDRMTLGLSGGQRRRVALAGVLALEPEVLILDEPTAGLDPQARRQLMAQILDLHEKGVTLIIVSHNMEELAEVCDRIVVLANGRTLVSGTPHEIFADPNALQTQGLDVPDSTEIAQALIDEGLLPQMVITNVDEAVSAISSLLDGEVL